jgi:hypothetical protein
MPPLLWPQRPTFIGRAVILCTATMTATASWTVDARPVREEASTARLLPQRASNKRASNQSIPWAGEGMTFEIFFGPLRIGRAALAIGQPRRGREHTIAVRGRAELLPLAGKLLQFREEQHTVVDLETLRPLRSTLRSQKHGQVKTTRTHYATQRSERTRQEIVGRNKTRRRARLLPTPSLDPFSTLLQLRGKMVRSGKRQRLTVLAGTKLYRLDVAVAGTESVTVGSERKRARRIDVTARRITDRGRRIPGKHPTHFAVWLSPDARQIPLAGHIRSSKGRFRLQLSSYRRIGPRSAHHASSRAEVGDATDSPLVASNSSGPTRPTGSRLSGASRP